VPGWLRPVAEEVARRGIRALERFLGIDSGPEAPPARCVATLQATGAQCVHRAGHDGRHTFRMSEVRAKRGWRPEGPPSA
jgi:hypothetical protein